MDTNYEVEVTLKTHMLFSSTVPIVDAIACITDAASKEGAKVINVDIVTTNTIQ